MNGFIQTVSGLVAKIPGMDGFSLGEIARAAAAAEDRQQLCRRSDGGLAGLRAGACGDPGERSDGGFLRRGEGPRGEERARRHRRGRRRRRRRDEEGRRARPRTAWRPRRPRSTGDATRWRNTPRTPKAVGKNLGDSLAGAFTSAEEAVGNFVKTGKLDIRDLVTSMLADLAKLSVKQAILGPLAEVALRPVRATAAASRRPASGRSSPGCSTTAAGSAPVGRIAIPARRDPGAAPRFHNGGGFGLAQRRAGRRASARRAGAEPPPDPGLGSRRRRPDHHQRPRRGVLPASRSQIAADIARAVAAGPQELSDHGVPRHPLSRQHQPGRPGRPRAPHPDRRAGERRRGAQQPLGQLPPPL